LTDVEIKAHGKDLSGVKRGTALVARRAGSVRCARWGAWVVSSGRSGLWSQDSAGRL